MLRERVIVNVTLDPESCGMMLALCVATVFLSLGIHVAKLHNNKKIIFTTNICVKNILRRIVFFNALQDLRKIGVGRFGMTRGILHELSLSSQ